MLSTGQYIEETSKSHGAPNWTQIIGKSPGAFHGGTNPTILWKVSDKIATAFQLRSYYKWDKMLYDVGYLTCDMWYLIWNVGPTGYIMISVYLVLWFGYYFTHALKYPIPFSARTLASMPHALGDGESLTFAESMGGLTTNQNLCLQRSSESNCCLWLQEYIVYHS